MSDISYKAKIACKQLNNFFCEEEDKTEGDDSE